ncbi:MAG: CRISPR-associated CARF protein Csx1 [Sulfolobales archaeon]
MISLSRTIIISTWGSPSKWRCARYVYSNDNMIKESRSCSSCSSLPLLTTLYPNSDVVVIVLDSLVDYVKTGKEVKEVADSTCSYCYEVCFKPISSFNNYSDLECFVKDFAKCVIKCVYETDGFTLPNFEVVVGPSVGSPGGKWVFKGNATDFIAKILLGLGVIFYRMCYNEIVLDLTHGINFMPAEVLYLVRMLASLSIVAHNLKEVEVLVFNSDPYPSSGAGGGGICSVCSVMPELNLNLIYKEVVRGIYIPPRIPSKVLSVRFTPSEELKKLRDELTKYVSITRYIVSSLLYPFPLALCNSCNDLGTNIQDTLDEVLSKILSAWMNGIEVDADRKVVRRSIDLFVDSIYMFMLAAYTCKRVSEVGNLTEVSIKKLKNLSELYRSIIEPYEYLVKNELSKVELMCSNLEPDVCRNYSELIGSSGLLDRKKPKEVGTPDNRVMIAHIGLQQEFVEICNKANECVVKYTTPYKELLRRRGLLIDEV